MANRRMGGMGGGPQRGNHRSFSQHQPFQGNVSPWQGPSNNSLNPGLLSQLATSPQQLALALSNLLQPHQQHMNNPPSLLSLNTSPAFSHQDRDPLNRFNRGRSDFRRNEPYNKNRNGSWRPMDKNMAMRNNNNRTPFVARDRRRSPMRPKNNDSFNKRKFEKKDGVGGGASIAVAAATTPTKVAVASNDGKPEISNDVSVEEGRDDDGNEDAKRDWKEEKNVPDESKDDETMNVEDAEEKKPDGNVSGNLDGKYYGVPQKYLHCFVCNKDMWDGESFEKHIRGRAHKQMLQSMEESFHITVNILRENMRLAEEKKVIELNRMHRLSKNKFNRKFQEPESHCNMCDLKFLGKIISHRKTDGHQRLKRFLHPNCDICSKEFPSRMDWVDHRLTPEHLRQLHENLEGKLGGEDGAIMEQPEEIDLESIMEESMMLEDENPIIELSDDLNNVQNRIPAYRNDRALGTKNLRAITGFLCEICNRAFADEEDAQAHLKTERHYYAFVEACKTKYKKQSEEAAAKEAESKKRKLEESKVAVELKVEKSAENGDEDMYDPEEACNEEEEEEPPLPEESEVEAEVEMIEEEAPAAVVVEEPPVVVKEEPELPAVPATPPVSIKVEPTTPGEQNVINTATPRTRRSVGVAAAAAATAAATTPKATPITPGGAKGKKLTTVNPEESDEMQQTSPALSAFRIPKLGGNVKNGAGPKSKKLKK